MADLLLWAGYYVAVYAYKSIFPSNDTTTNNTNANAAPQKKKMILIPPKFDTKVHRYGMSSPPLAVYQRDLNSLMSHFFTNGKPFQATLRMSPRIDQTEVADIDATISVPTLSSVTDPGTTPSRTLHSDINLYYQPSIEDQDTYANFNINVNKVGTASFTGCYTHKFDDNSNYAPSATQVNDMIKSCSVFVKVPVMNQASSIPIEQTNNNNTYAGIRYDANTTSVGVFTNPSIYLNNINIQNLNLNLNNNQNQQAFANINADLNLNIDANGNQAQPVANQQHGNDNNQDINGWFSHKIKNFFGGISMSFSPQTRNLSKDLYLYYTLPHQHTHSNEQKNNLSNKFQLGFESKKNGRETVFSYLHQLVVRRRCHNPFEDDDVVGIVNYIDLGLQLKYQHDVAPEMSMACGWQMNKNNLFKVRISPNSINTVYGFKSWFEPSATLTLDTHFDLHTRSTKFGASFIVENFGNLLFGQTNSNYKRTIPNMKQDVTMKVQADPDF